MVPYDISLDKLSDTFSVSSGQAGKMIRQHTGRSYKDYLTGLRVEYAKRLLRQGDLRVADVCARTGYANISHFIKVFRLQTGITPLQYKKNLSGG